MKKKAFFLCFMILFCNFVEIVFSLESSQNESQEALLALSEAINAVGTGAYDDAVKMAEKVTLFNPLLADGWYVQALSASISENEPYKILPLLKKALACSHWIFYNKNACMSLYLRYLCEVKNYDEVFSLTENLTENSPADFFYARAWSLYAKNKLTPARELLKEANHRFPFEPQFLKLFFMREAKKTPLVPAQEKLALDFLRVLETSDLNSVDLINSSIPFIPHPEDRKRLLLSCFSERSPVWRSLQNKPLGFASLKFSSYLSLAADSPYNPLTDSELVTNLLQYGLIPEEEALETIKSFARFGVPFEALFKLSGLFSSEELSQNFLKYLSDFSDCILVDENDDGLYEQRIFYINGRPSRVIYDSNQDGINDWEVSCNFGSPVSVFLPERNIKVFYSKFPSVDKIETQDKTYLLVPGKLKWTPINFVARSFPAGHNLKFYLPEHAKNVSVLSENLIVKNTAVLIQQSKEKNNIIEQIEMLDGVPVSSVIAQNNQPYAYGFYARGHLESRKIDMDLDGSFEAFETYKWNPSQKESTLARFWIDANRNGNFEYIENYFEEEKGFTQFQWDYDDDGIVDAEYKRFTDGREQTIIKHPITGLTCEILSQNATPLFVSYAGSVKKLQPSQVGNLYWIGGCDLDSTTEEALAIKVQELYNLSASSFVSVMLNIEGLNIFVTKNGVLYYAEIQASR